MVAKQGSPRPDPVAGPGPLSLPAFSDAVFFVGLAVQFGLQPTLNKNFIENGVSSSVLIMVTETLKILLSLFMLKLSTSAESRREIFQSLTWRESITRAGFPAFLYSIQNWLILLGSKHISALSVSILNQTKTLSAAFFAWILLGKKQSPLQLVALVGLFVGAALIISAEDVNNPIHKGTKETQLDSSSVTGIMAVGGASLISGLSSAASELALSRPIGNGKVPKNAASLIFSIELALFGIVTLITSAVVGLNPDKTVFSHPLKNWSPNTLIPVLSNACGGILVGIVTQRAGGVKKGMSLILGICLAAFIERILGSKTFTVIHLVAVFLVAVSMALYFTFPYSVQIKKKED